METDRQPEEIVEARRKFLATCGRFAAVTPPAVALLLSSAEQNFAVAQSGSHHASRRGNNGFGNGGFDGVPGHSGKQDITR